MGVEYKGNQRRASYFDANTGEALGNSLDQTETSLGSSDEFTRYPLPTLLTFMRQQLVQSFEHQK